MGACACGGGVVAGSYATAGGFDQRIPMDVYVPGCPPRPQDILQWLLLALDRRDQKISASTRTVELGMLGDSS